MVKYLVMDLPIEPVERRYSALWTQWFSDAFKRNNLNYVSIKGTETGQPSPDKFLDPFSTIKWKLTQLDNALDVIKRREFDRYILHLHDGWMPGCEALAYIRDLEGIDIKVCAWWHAGSYDPWDLLAQKQCYHWACGCEESWLEIADMILLATEFHKGLICTQRTIDPMRIYVVGLPVEVPHIDAPKENLVIWPHRLAREKHPEMFDRLASLKRFKGVKFVKTMEVKGSKSVYWDLLARAKVAVSTAKQETFGIAMVESALMGCTPLCPDTLSYPETMEEYCLYSSFFELQNKVEECLSCDETYEYPFRDDYTVAQVTDNVCALIRDLAL